MSIFGRFWREVLRASPISMPATSLLIVLFQRLLEVYPATCKRGAVLASARTELPEVPRSSRYNPRGSTNDGPTK